MGGICKCSSHYIYPHVHAQVRVWQSFCISVIVVIVGTKITILGDAQTQLIKLY